MDVALTLEEFAAKVNADEVGPIAFASRDLRTICGIPERERIIERIAALGLYYRKRPVTIDHKPVNVVLNDQMKTKLDKDWDADILETILVGYRGKKALGILLGIRPYWTRDELKLARIK
jgi:hypothetical protein